MKATHTRLRREQIASRVRGLVEDQYDSHAGFAKATGQTEMSVSRMLSAKRSISAEDVTALAQRFDVSADFLLGLTNARVADVGGVEGDFLMVPVVDLAGIASDVAVASSRNREPLHLEWLLKRRDIAEKAAENPVRYALTRTPARYSGEAVGPHTTALVDRVIDDNHLHNTLAVIVDEDDDAHIRRTWESGDLVIGVANDAPPIVRKTRKAVKGIIVAMWVLPS